MEHFHVKQRYFWPASGLDATPNLQLELLQWLYSKTGCSTLQMYFTVTSIKPFLLSGVGQQGHLFIITTYLCYQFLSFPPHLYVTCLLSTAHNALNHLLCLMCTFFFHLLLLKNEKRVRGFDIKLSYLPTTARLCSEPHAIWKRSMNE